MRVFVASLATETNTFSPLFVVGPRSNPPSIVLPARIPTRRPYARPRWSPRGDAQRRVISRSSKGTATWAEPAGLVSREAYESLRDEILDQLKAALPVDVVLFGLHGSMVARGYDDCEGDLLARARAIVGRLGHRRGRTGHALSLDRPDGPGRGCHRRIQRVPTYGFLERAEDLVDLCLRAARHEVSRSARFSIAAPSRAS